MRITTHEIKLVYENMKQSKVNLFGGTSCNAVIKGDLVYKIVPYQVCLEKGPSPADSPRTLTLFGGLHEKLCSTS